MRKIIQWVVASADGFVNGPNGEFDWAPLTPEMAEYSDRLHDRMDTFLYGRGVWEMMSGFWPEVPSEPDADEHDREFAKLWLETPKVVISRTLERADWNTQVISDNVAEQVKALKEKPGKDILITGGSGMPASLTALGLIDEYHIAVHPVVLGGGKPLFGKQDRLKLRLVDTRTVDSQVQILHYQPAQAAESS